MLHNSIDVRLHVFSIGGGGGKDSGISAVVYT